jgi:hypothetical protein
MPVASYDAAAMPPRHLLGATTLGLLVAAACGGRSTLSVPDCNAAAVTYCQANGCPFTGPASSTAAGLTTWCSAASAFSARVTGYGTCVTPAGEPWAIDVKASDAHGNELYVLYDPTTSQLLSVSTLAPGDSGTGEQDYGTCGENTGIVTCSSVVFACDR